MPTLTCGITYLEGLPGLGKTTVAVGLATHLDQVVLVAENNPLPADHTRVTGLSPTAAATWYLQAEQRRSAYAIRLTDRLCRHARPDPPHVVCDKSALATLAYTYAGSAVGLHPPTVYPQTRDLYEHRIRPYLPHNATTILFTGTPDLGLTRRSSKPDRAQRPIWFSPDFLHALADFYTEHAPGLTPHRLVRLDTSTDPHRLLSETTTVLGLSLPTTTCTPDTVGYGDLPSPFRRAAELIGPAVLGQALGAPFHHPAGDAIERQIRLTARNRSVNLAQAFERHLLIAHGYDGVVRLQARHWTLTSPDPTPSAGRSRPPTPASTTTPRRGTHT